jgi:glycosyltransferase involved in cell wall biosynthesis
MVHTVLYLVSTLERTGTVAVIKGIVNHLDLKQFRPVIATLSPERQHSCMDEFKAAGIELVRIDMTRLESMTLGTRRLKEVVHALGADIVHGHEFRPDVLMAGARLDACTVSTIHSMLDYLPVYGGVLGRWMVQSHYRALRHLDAAVAVSAAVAAAAARHRVASRTIINGVDTGRYRPAATGPEYVDARARMGVPANKIVILYSGKLISIKRPVELIERFRLSQSEAVLVVAGDGPLGPKCRAAAANADNIVFLGRRADVPELLRGADYAISASVTEGLPMALLEACAAGLRIIASDIPPHQEIRSLSPGNVTLFSAGDPAALERVLKSMHLSPTQRRVDPEVLGKISSLAMSHAYQALYSELLN